MIYDPSLDDPAIIAATPGLPSPAAPAPSYVSSCLSPRCFLAMSAAGVQSRSSASSEAEPATPANQGAKYFFAVAGLGAGWVSESDAACGTAGAASVAARH